MARKARKKNEKENHKLLQEAYLSDPEYRAVLIKKIVEEDKEMEDITTELAKLLQEVSEE